MSIRAIVILLLSTIISFHALSQKDTLVVIIDTVPDLSDTIMVSSDSIVRLDSLDAILSGFDLLNYRIDSLITLGIRAEAFPGCVIYVLKDGMELLRKTYGFHTYDSIQALDFYDIFDLASVSKNTGGVLAMMKLYELGLVELDQPINKYVRGLRLNRRGKSTVREALAHQAGLKAWIKFHEEIKKPDRTYKRKTIAHKPSEEFPFQVAENQYAHKDLYKKIKRLIKRSAFNPEKNYVYSDLFFYLVPEIVTNLTGMEYEAFLKYHYYDSMQAKTIGFNPLDEFDMLSIVPTEIDTFFRMESIHGTVHDEGAILMKGVSGHAGLFANASDLSKVWQMLLNEGTYNGKRYLEPATIALFTAYQYPSNNSRRALGFDKPLLKYDPEKSSVAPQASVYSYGHSGYTGTFVWVDPEYDLVYIFLSNRVYPDRGHRAIYELNIRPQVHTWIYDFLTSEGVEYK